MSMRNLLLEMVKAPRHWFGTSPTICRLAGLGLNKVKGVLAEVCILCGASILVS